VRTEEQKVGGDAVGIGMGRRKGKVGEGGGSQTDKVVSTLKEPSSKHTVNGIEERRIRR
jgi:hypothetical protein